MGEGVGCGSVTGLSTTAVSAQRSAAVVSPMPTWPADRTGPADAAKPVNPVRLSVSAAMIRVVRAGVSRLTCRDVEAPAARRIDPAGAWACTRGALDSPLPVADETAHAGGHGEGDGGLAVGRCGGDGDGRLADLSGDVGVPDLGRVGPGGPSVDAGEAQSRRPRRVTRMRARGVAADKDDDVLPGP